MAPSQDILRLNATVWRQKGERHGDMEIFYNNNKHYIESDRCKGVHIIFHNYKIS